MILDNGKPADSSNRQERELRTYALLDSLGISYLRADHAAAMTMEDCIAVDEALGTAMCKNLFLCNRQQTAFYLLMMPGGKKFRTKDVSAQIGSSRLSFASEEHMIALLDIHPGSVSVLGLMNDHEKKIQLLVDRDLLDEPFIGCHPCVNTSSLRIAQQDLWEKFLPAVNHQRRIIDLPDAE